MTDTAERDLGALISRHDARLGGARTVAGWLIGIGLLELRELGVVHTVVTGEGRDVARVPWADIAEVTRAASGFALVRPDGSRLAIPERLPQAAEAAELVRQSARLGALCESAAAVLRRNRSAAARFVLLARISVPSLVTAAVLLVPVSSPSSRAPVQASPVAGALSTAAFLAAFLLVLVASMSRRVRREVKRELWLLLLGTLFLTVTLRTLLPGPH